MATVGITRLIKSYASNRVLSGLDLEAGQHEFVTLLGPSGCGKTTTLRCVAGLERADGGEIRIGETVVAAPGRKVFVPPNRRDIGMVFQSYALWPHMTVFANVAYPLKVRRVERPDARRRVMELLEALGLGPLAERQVTELSGGQQQRVALARAMVGRPGLLLFDEPLSNLDAKLRKSMRREIRAAHDRSGATSLYVTHDQEEALTLSDRVVVMRGGVIQQLGAPRDIYRSPANAFVAEFVGFDNIIPADVAAVREGAVGLRLPGTAAGAEAWVEASHTPTGPVTVAVRAEHVVFGPTGPLTGVVVATAYTGDMVECTVEVGGVRLLARHPDSGVTRSPGDPVHLTLDPQRSVVLPPEDRPSASAPVRVTAPVVGAGA